jgi:hypothetical protein
MEAVGAIEGNLTGLPSGWWGQELPGRSAEGTYSHYDLHKLPPLPRAAIDSDLPWLRDAPAPGGDPTGSCQSEPWALLLSSLEAKGYALPAALHTLMTHEEMQRAIPAPTANYFIGAGEDGGESNAATLQEIREGVLFLPFYSDQQCCVRWGLWLSRDETGYAPVIAASLDFGEDGDGPVRYVDFEFSASTVESFVYRTWVENRIWFATKFCQPPRELLDFEKDYLEG